MRFIGLAIVAVALATPSWSAPRIEDVLISVKNAPANERKDAYRYLENSFKDPQTESGLKAQIAYLLAFANPRHLGRKRYVYAKHALENLPKLPAEPRFRLQRILGDGAFDDANFPLAVKGFEDALRVPEVADSDREYVTYKLGWVLVNEKKFSQALALWSSWLKGHTDTALRKDMIRDFGKLWSEAALADTEMQPIHEKFSEEDTAVFLKGLMVGFRRDKGASLEKLASELSKQRDYPLFVRVGLNEGSLEAGRTLCDPLVWLQRTDVAAVGPDVVRPVLNSCVKKLEKSNQPELAKLVAKTYEKAPVLGADRWPRARAYELSAQYQQACAEYRAASVEVLDEKAVTAETKKGLLRKVSEGCTDLSATEIAPFMDKLFSSSWMAERVRLDSNEWGGELLRFSTKPQWRETILASLGKNRGLWASSVLPEALADQWASESDAGKQWALVELFAEAPLEGVFLAVVSKRLDDLSDAEKWTDARKLLDSYFPLTTRLTPETLKPWLRYLVALDDHQFQNLSPKSLVNDVVTAVLSHDPVRSERKLCVVLLMRQQNFPSLAAQWNRLGAVIASEPGLLEPFANWVFASPQVVLPKDGTPAQTEFVAYVDQIRALTTIASADANVKLKVPAALAKSPLVADATVLVNVKKLEKNFTGLNLNAAKKLEQKLASSIERLKARLFEVKKHKWVHAEMALAANASLRGATLKLADAIDGIKTDDAAAIAELKELSSVLREWARELGEVGT